jgi:hypothetical protein
LPDALQVGNIFPCTRRASSGLAIPRYRQARRPCAQARLPPDAAAFRHLLAADDLKEGRFPGSVAAEYAHTFACFYLQARIVEKRDVAEGYRDVVKGNERQLRDRKL